MLLDCVTLAKALCDVRNDQSESLTRDRREKERDREKADLYKRPKKNRARSGFYCLKFKAGAISFMVYLLKFYLNTQIQMFNKFALLTMIRPIPFQCGRFDVGKIVVALARKCDYAVLC